MAHNPILETRRTSSESFKKERYGPSIFRAAYLSLANAVKSIAIEAAMKNVESPNLNILWDLVFLNSGNENLYPR
jgi:hypothetical protein